MKVLARSLAPVVVGACVFCLVSASAGSLPEHASQNTPGASASLRGTRDKAHHTLSSMWTDTKHFFGNIWNELERPAFEGDDLSTSVDDALRGVRATTMDHCNGSSGDLFAVESASFQPNTFTVATKGKLLQTLQPGNISVKVKLDKMAGNITLVQRFKRHVIWMFGEHRRTRESLCNNLRRTNSSCTLMEGQQTLTFSLAHLPYLYLRAAGNYSIEIQMTDDADRRLSCLSLTLPLTSAMSSTGSATARPAPVDNNVMSRSGATSAESITASLEPVGSWEPWQIVRA